MMSFKSYEILSHQINDLDQINGPNLKRRTNNIYFDAEFNAKVWHVVLGAAILDYMYIVHTLG